ncbi:MAG: glycosyltransferase family 2 protein [Actinomycetota bacterium]
MSALAIVIPALDEADSVGGSVSELREHTDAPIYVVDNGSTDATAEVAARAGAIVVSEPRRGYGWACLAGSRAALDGGADVIVYFDADRSSRPDELDELLAPIATDAADLVLGSRLLGTVEPGSMAPHQRFGNWLTAAIMRRIYRIEVTDLGPFRAIRSDVYASLDMTEMTFGWPTEMTLRCATSGARIVEVPVTWQARSAGESKVSGTVVGSVKAAWHILGVTFRFARRR